MHAGAQEAELGEMSGQFKVIDGQVTVGVGEGDESPPNIRRECTAPQYRRSAVAPKNTSHSFATRIVAALGGGVRWQDFHHVRFSCHQRVDESPPVVQFVVHALREGYAPRVLEERVLQVTKKAHATG